MTTPCLPSNLSPDFRRDPHTRSCNAGQGLYLDPRSDAASLGFVHRGYRTHEAHR
jgi:hypothetical protein